MKIVSRKKRAMTIALILILSVWLMGCSRDTRHTNNQKNGDNEKEMIQEISLEILEGLRDFNLEVIVEHVHPTKGVRFSPYTDLEPSDLIFFIEEIMRLQSSNQKYIWGAYDGSGFDIELTPKEYFNRFLYPVDYINNSHVTGYNEVVSTPLYEGNYKKYYKDAVYIEYFYNGTKDAYNMDWKSIRLVFEKYNRKWYLVGLINSEKTI